MHRTTVQELGRVVDSQQRLIVAEFLYGTRVNRDAHRNRARPLQIRSTFRF